MHPIPSLLEYGNVHVRSLRSLATLLGATALLAAAPAGKAAELLRNGSFDNVLVDWTVAESLGDWLPYQHPAGNLSLQTEAYNYKGLLLSQALNVAGIANQQISAAIDLQASSALSAGKTYALYLEYLNDVGTLQRAKLINPDNTAIPVSPTVAATFSGNFTFPANATKLVRLTIEKETADYASALLDNIHLTSAALTPGEVPHLAALSSDHVAYAQTLTLAGSGFGGTSAPLVLINGTTSGLTVNAWTATTISVGVNAPAASGNISVVVAGTPAVERRHLEITSPHLVLATAATPLYAVAGQELGLDVQVDFRSGFVATPPGVQLQILKGGTAFAGGSFAPGQVPRTGGTHLTIDTASLAVGQNTLQVRATHGTLTLDAFFDVVIEVPASLRLYANDVLAASPLTINTQANVTASAELLDASGTVLTANPPLVWSSSNDSVFKIFPGSRPWDGTSLLVKNDGDAVLHISGPGALHFQFPVHVDTPDSPRILACQLGALIVDNSGSLPENTLYYQFTEVLSGFSWGVSDMSASFGDGSWGADSKSYTGRFRVVEGQLPGRFLIFAGSNGMGGADVLTITNASDKGMVTGHVKSFGGSSGMHEEGQVSGTLGFYDSATETLLFQRDIFEWSDTYHAAYLPPGSYKVRWTPMMGDQQPQWYPLANSHADATPVVVTAGATTPNIHFFFTSASNSLAPPVMAGAASYSPSTGSFSVPIQTDSASRYQLQKSNSLLEGSWFNLGTPVWGNDAVQTFQDTTASGPRGYYRVLRL